MKKITFFTEIPGVADAYPVIDAKDFKPSWVGPARESYIAKNQNNNGSKFNHLYRCPGIFDIMQTGYIINSPWDIIIDTFGDGEKFKWTLPTSDLVDLSRAPLVGGHSSIDFSQYFPSRPGQLKSVIKFNTPWYVIAPKDLKFLIIPIPYSDTYDFESYHGILDPGYSAEINVQLKWNVLNGRHVIKAGTPLCQIIPLSSEKFQLEVRNGTEHDMGWIKRRNYFYNLSFVFKRNLMKEMYQKYFKR